MAVERTVQEEQAKFQDDKIKRLNETKELLALKSDSLEKNLTSRSIENEELRTQLAATDERINAYERRIDSLNAETIGSTGNPEEEAELAQLKKTNRRIGKQRQGVKDFGDRKRSRISKPRGAAGTDPKEFEGIRSGYQQAVGRNARTHVSSEETESKRN
jgi:septal ring factor EnvC (AmiA/AmiB activator)